MLTRSRILAMAALGVVPLSRAQDVSQPATLQMFESTWTNMESRAPDIFLAGYGAMWTPPPGRADSSNASVGYDVYDRFDLGSSGNATLYGTETSIKSMINTVHRFGGAVYTDLLMNHNGFRTSATPNFQTQGGYPGFVLSRAGDSDGDFHPAGASGLLDQRVAGLIDIAQEKNYLYVRNPVPGFAANIPAGTIANIPSENNRRFYPDQSLAPTVSTDPLNGQTVTTYPFNTTTPLNGDPISENAQQYLIRHAQWMVQVIGVDGFRLDAVKHVPVSTFNALDNTLYKSIKTPNLDGSQKHAFTFGEYLDSNRDLIQPYIRKTINPGSPTLVGGYRDALDYPLYYAMQSNLTTNMANNDWRNVVNASQDQRDDGLANNGSQGVSFAMSHDNVGTIGLSKVAHAYTMLRPGNAIVYFNAKEFGNGRSFPQNGKDDALGGFHGNAMTTLVDIRNRYGRGNYLPRTNEEDVLIYEREKSALVLLNSRTDSGYDARNVTTSFSAGTRLIELTGNAANPSIDPNNDLAEVIVVNANGTADVRVPRNANSSGTLTGNGYLIYGLPTPVGSLSLSNVSQTLPGGTPTASTNGTTRLASIPVITANSFTATLQTASVTLSNGYRDTAADGDSAYLKLDGGIDLNGSGTVDFRNPSSTTHYGFESFGTKSSPLVGGGDGEFVQLVNTTTLSEGYHYLEARAFRFRNDGGQPVYSSFKKVIYVDRLKPVSAVDTFLPWDAGNSQNRDLAVRSTDQTANAVHTFLNLPANLTDAQVIALVAAGNKASQVDRDLFKYGFFGVPSGNNVATIVTYEITGNVNVQRVAGITLATNKGLGFGDLNFDNQYTTGDVAFASGAFEPVLYSQNAQFNAAADLTGDGLVDNRDLYLLPARYASVGASAAVQNETRNMIVRRGNLNGDGMTTALDIDTLYNNFGSTTWLFNLDSDTGGADQQDVDTLVQTILLTRYGDANLDKLVNSSDFNILASNFGLSPRGWATGDFTGDDLVSSADFNALATNFGFSGALPGAAVPEPAILGFLGCLTLLSTRRMRLQK